MHVATYLNPVDEIIDDDPDDDHFIEHLAQTYARGPESDSDWPEVPVPDPISVPQALSAVMTLRSYAEQQKEDFRGLIRQLGSLERGEIKAQEVANRTQTTLNRFFHGQIDPKLDPNVALINLIT